MTDIPCQKVVFVTGAGHSGTTLLGMMLGAHPAALFAGEVQEFNAESGPACRTCGESCRVWSGIDASKNIYDELAQRSQKPIIIDSSKKIPQWIRPAVSSLAGRDVSLVFLIRDPRAIIASVKRKQPERSVTEIAAWWRGQMRRCETLAFDFPGPVVRIRYEELATRPAETLQAICAGIGLTFDEGMLNPWETPGHQLDGNVGVWSIASSRISELPPEKLPYYIHHGKKIKLDERWKGELDKATLEEIQEAVKPLWHAYAWNGYGN